MTDTCHPAGPGQRCLGPKHPGSHDECTPCDAIHCRDCSTTHVRGIDGELVEWTCPRCIGSVRTNIADIRSMHAQIPDEALHHPNAEIPGGTATYLLGAVCLDYGQAQARRIIDAVDYAAENGRRLTDDELARFTLDDPLPRDPIPELLTLATWEDACRDILDAGPGPRPATVDSAAIWLQSVLHRVAQHDAWPHLAADIRQCRDQLLGVLALGTWPARGVPCISVDCTADLRQTYIDPDPCTHDTPARRHVSRIPGWNHTARDLGYPEAVIGSEAIRAALRTARKPCEATGCDQGGRRSLWWCPACNRKYDQAEYDRARAHHMTRARLAERVG